MSVVIPSFNAATTLRATLHSVLAQPAQGIELIVIDGGSTDGTVAILKEFDADIDYWVSEPDDGVYDAMTKGIRVARGDWHCFLGADDTLTEGFSRMLGHLSDAAKIYYGDVWMPTRGIRYDGAFSPMKLARRNICHQGILYPRIVWARHRFDPRYAVKADYALNLACLGDPELHLQYVPELIAVFNDGLGLSQRRTDADFERDKLRLIRSNLPRTVYLGALLWHWGLRLAEGSGLYRTLWRLKLAAKRRFQAR